jgi:hypothetical protein
MHFATLKSACTFLALFSILILGIPALTGTLHAQATGGISGGGTTTTPPPPPDPAPNCYNDPGSWSSTDANGNGCGTYYNGCGMAFGSAVCCTQQPSDWSCNSGTSCTGSDPSTGCAYQGADNITCTQTDCMGNASTQVYQTCQPSASCVADNTPPPAPPPPPIVLVNGVNQFSGFFTVPNVTGSGRKATVTIKVTSTTATPITFNAGTPSSGALFDIAPGQTFSGQYLDPSTGSNTSNIAGFTALNRSGISFVMKQTLVTSQNAPPGNPSAKADDPADGPDVFLYGLNGNGQTNYSFDVTVLQDTKFSILAFAQLDGNGTPMRPPTDITMTMTPVSLVTVPLMPTGTIKIPPSSTGNYQPGAIVPIDWSINYN